MNEPELHIIITKEGIKKFKITGELSPGEGLWFHKKRAMTCDHSLIIALRLRIQ